MKYSDSLKIPDDGIGVSDVRHMQDFLTGLGSVDTPGGWDDIRFHIEAPDLWDLAMMVAEIQDEARAYGFDYVPNKHYARD
jgi:hypothetical protein